MPEMRQHGRMTSAWVLDEDDAMELLAYLITAARTQLDEAAEYGPMRLLTAAHRLAGMIDARASAETRALLEGAVARLPLLAVPRDDRDGYTAQVDGACRAVADHLAARYGAEPTPA
jgi:hypothetical protein